MIAKDTLSKKHIEAEFKRMKMADPAVLERTMHAFVLLERLALSDMPFLFKGGTSLLLALGKPERVSVDIDIVCQVPKDKFESEMKEWVRHPPFTRWENDVSVIRRADGKTVYDVTFPKEALPFADLRPRHGNVIGAGLLVNDRCKDAAGEFKASYQSKQQYNTPKNWKDLYLSYDRPGCNALISLAGRKPVKASVASGSVVDEYMPTADGVVSCRVSAEWGSILTLEDVAVEGAEVSRRPELPLTLPYPKSAELKLKVKAGVPVKVSAKVKITTGE